MTNEKLRRSAEEMYEGELKALSKGDERPRPENWLLSPQAVVTYLLGGTATDGTPYHRSMSAIGGSSRRRSPRWRPIGRFCSSGFPGPRSPGCRNIWRRPCPARRSG